MERERLAADALRDRLATGRFQGVMEAYRYLFKRLLAARDWQISVVAAYIGCINKNMDTLRSGIFTISQTCYERQVAEIFSVVYKFLIEH